MQIVAMLITASALVILMADVGAAKTTTFTLGDLAGEWNLHGLTSGYPGDFQSWAYGTMICDGSGVFTQRSTDRADDEASPVGGKFEITPDGIITIPGGSGHGSSLHGVMRSNKDTMVLTGNDGGGGYALVVYTKSDGRFVTSDLEGTWFYHVLVSGEVPGWLYGSTTIDKGGNALFDSPLVDSEGGKHIPYGVKLGITEGGIVTELEPEWASFRGAMNQGRDMIVVVATMGPEEWPTVRGYSLWVLEKQAPGAYTIGDLAGTWYLHELASGASYDEWIGWCYDTLLFDKRGNGNSVAGSYLDCRGETDHEWSGTMSITSDGIITLSNMPVFHFHGIMNLGKDMWVGTMNDGGGGYGLLIAVGRPGDDFDFNADGRVDFIDFANLASHWLN